MNNDSDYETITGVDGRPVRVIRDKKSVKVPLQMMDHETVRPQRASLRDALHRPGYRTASMLQQHTAQAATDATLVAARAAKEAAYAQYQKGTPSLLGTPL